MKTIAKSEKNNCIDIFKIKICALLKAQNRLQLNLTFKYFYISVLNQNVIDPNYEACVGYMKLPDVRSCEFSMTKLFVSNLVLLKSKKYMIYNLHICDYTTCHK